MVLNDKKGDLIFRRSGIFYCDVREERRQRGLEEGKKKDKATTKENHNTSYVSNFALVFEARQVIQFESYLIF